MAADVGSAADQCEAAKSMPFSKVCEALEFIDKSTSTTGKANVRETCQEALGKLFNRWRQVARYNADTEDNAFHLIRLLVPHLDRERPPYNLKEQKLGRFLIDLLSISKTSSDAEALLNYKAPKGGGAKGDFASVVFHILNRRAVCPKASELSVATLNLQLDTFAKNQQDGVQGKTSSTTEFHDFIKKLSAKDMKWLIRIILKDLKVKMGQRSIFNAYHPDADDFFNVNSNLRKLCATLADPSKRLCEIEIQLFTPFKPMLADRSDSVDDAMKKMSNAEFFLETKLDGERIQIHKDGGTYKYFTRNYHDASSYFGPTANDGSLSRHIEPSFKSSVHSVILDGEMIGFEPSTGARVSKAESLDVKGLKDGADGPQPCFYVFDVLFLNGKVLTGRPFKERVQILNRSVFDPIEGRIMHVNRQAGREKESVAQFFNDAIDAREEGIIVKAANSHYQANSRKGGWLKLKPEYVDSLTETFDLVIVGGYFGAGHRGSVSLVTHFLLALRHDAADGKREYHTVSRVGSGYTFLELQELNNTLKDSFVQNTGESSRPQNVLASSKGKGRPDVWVKPEHSVVVEIKAAELIDSEVFYVGHTLRFPRLQHFRKDKGVDDIMTTKEFSSMLHRNRGKITTGVVSSSSPSSSASPKRKRFDPLITSPAKRSLAAQYSATDLTNVEAISDAFEGKEFVILNDPPGFSSNIRSSPLKKSTSSSSSSKSYHMSRADLQVRVTQLGGSISQNPTRTTFCIASFIPDDLRTKNFASSGKYLIVKGDWLCRCVEAQKMLPLSPLDCIFADEKIRRGFVGKFDIYGDAFDEDVDEEILRDLVDNIDGTSSKVLESVKSSEVEALKEDLFDGLPFAIFYGRNFYIDLYKLIGDPSTKIRNSSLEVVAIDVTRFCGTISETLNDSVTHVICDDVERAEGFRQLRRGRTKKFHLVSSSWVENCIKEKRLVEERVYDPC